MAPPLIRKVRALAKPGAVTIVDAPPGTSCPVIAAVRGADFVVLVSEPTPFGLNDLALALETVQMLGIPCGLVINRSDIGDDRLREFAQREALPILLEIPFDRRIAEAYATGVMLVDRLPEWRAAFTDLFEKIQTMVEWERGA
jgi:MinD superfamily P-loop ATPase